jgi:small subunit ribosomal protein S20
MVAEGQEGERKRLSTKERRKRRVRRQVSKSEKRRRQNRLHLTAMRNAIKEFRKAIEQGQGKESLEALYKKALKRIHRAGNKGVIHRNEVSRRVSRITMAYNKALRAQEKPAAEA